METKLKISGFKCFSGDEFNLKKITVLTGSNGAGKSSLIQALLLTRLAIEKNLRHHNANDYLLSEEWNDLLVPLNDGYMLKLGTIYDIIRDKENSQNIISITLDNELYQFSIPKDPNENTSIKVLFENKGIDYTIPFWRKKEFYYLNTERYGPRHSLEGNSTEFVHCGYQGERTAQVLVKISQDTEFFSAMITDKAIKLDQLVNYWINVICPGVLISAIPLSSLSAQIRVRSNVGGSEMLATNIGFGISYSLPIIVTGLIAKKGSVFIVENPEAHLHPKAQSNMGFFLGKVAEAGVKVIIETHSEHIVNGIRRAALSSEFLKPNEVMIYFLEGFNNKQRLQKREIGIEQQGNLSLFPKDFFDQVNQDLSKIYMLSQQIKNGEFNNL